jgi:hypothetical protein
MVFKPEVLNTPNGIILRHNWYKNRQMIDDLQEHMIEHESLFDREVFPNKKGRLLPIAETNETENNKEE